MRSTYSIINEQSFATLNLAGVMPPEELVQFTFFCKIITFSVKLKLLKMLFKRFLCYFGNVRPWFEFDI